MKWNLSRIFFFGSTPLTPSRLLYYWFRFRHIWTSRIMWSQVWAISNKFQRKFVLKKFSISIFTYWMMYEKASGKCVNLAKSRLMWAPLREMNVSNLLWVPKAIENSFYLGLPIVVGWNKKVVFAFIKAKIWQRI